MARAAGFASLLAALAAACAAPLLPAVVPPAPPAEVTTPAAPPAPSAAPDEPLPAIEDAVARTVAVRQDWADVRFRDDRRARWLTDFDERTVRRRLGAINGACLARRDREACRLDGRTEAGQATQILLEMLGEMADPAPPSDASLRLLVRLEARGLGDARDAVRRILERRMLASPRVCAPPTVAELVDARRALDDFAVVVPAAAPSTGLVARWPTAAELDDLAYFYAIVTGTEAGPEVGSAREDLAAGRLPATHPDRAARKELAERAKDALLDGDVARHLDAAEAYLRTLGYPDPLRIAEEDLPRRSGAQASFLMRDAARSAEILGRYDVAEALYRRVSPGDAAHDSLAQARRDEQIAGAIRVAEQRRGCRGAAAERLFAVCSDGRHLYGPERLAKAGVGVARLYAGALLTLEREDAAALERALHGLPSRSGEALARLAQRGTEAWAARVRAIPGYADVKQGAGLSRLLGVAERGARAARVEALDALSEVAAERGDDPCVKSSFGLGGGHGSSQRKREVSNLMHACETRIPLAPREAAALRIAALAGDPDPEVREHAAAALGKLGLPSGRRALLVLRRDTFEPADQYCTSDGVCGHERPVADAAEWALLALHAADEARAQQRASARGK